MSIYAKTADGWVPLTGGSRVGAPGAPVITNPEGSTVIYFTAGTEGAAGPTLAYGSTIEPSNDGETVVVDQETLEVAVEGTSPSTDYVVSVYGVNVAGVGQQSVTDPFQLNYNAASGGTETVVDDYNGTGEQWKIHTFESSGTLSVTSAPNDFRYLVVGAGGSGGGKPSPEGGGGGCGGVVDTVGLLSVGDIAITVGVGQGYSETGNADGSSIGDIVVAGGGGQGGSGYGGGGGNSGSPLTTTGAGGSSSAQTCGGGAGASANGSSKNGGFGVTTTIGGSVSTDFAGGGGGGNRGKGPGAGASGGGNARSPNGDSASRIGSGGGGSDFDGSGGSGFRGEVVVAYKIGVSTTTQIRLAQEQRSAHAAGREVGYGEGFTDGIVQRNAEIAEAAADVREAVEAAAAAVEAKPKRTRKKAD